MTPQGVPHTWHYSRVGIDVQIQEYCPHGYALLWGETCPANHWGDSTEVDPCPSTLRDARPHTSELRLTAQRLVALSQWIDANNAHRDPEAVLWSRVLKVTEEAGEVYAALSGTIGENPRKGVTHTMDDVVAELLDVASAALCAVEHITDHRGEALAMLATRIAGTAERARISLSLTDAPIPEKPK